MKKTYSILAVVAMAIIAIAMAFVSCKKEKETTQLQQSNFMKEDFDLRQISDIDAYLKDFRLK